MNKNTSLRDTLFGPRGEDAIIDVTMLGAVGVGKTTLLASMYERFGSVIGGTDLAVGPADRGTTVVLAGYINDLRRVTSTVRAQDGLAGTGDVREYLFKVGRKGREPLFDLRFTDYPGKYLINPNADGGDKLGRALNRADVVVVAIDTPSLMERQRRFHDLINTPMLVNDMIMRMTERDTPRLIILAPLKCERWVASPEGAQQLADRVHEAYRPLLDQLGSQTLRARTACVLAPVQTVGSVVFSRLEEDSSGHPIFHFRLKKAGLAYAPMDTDQLLRYSLRFIVNKYRSSERGLVRAVWERVIGTDEALVRAVEEFSNGCKTTGGFAVLQDHPLLVPGRQP
ncbi:hypothetical protein Acor_63380 [Acrocarpospora corrugata]|uniref:Double-GTPase 2 domain-containing protein n=1 Tax=Acrocarpospora corrugata TaxID=35763 RepID=A0A5M3W7Q8_9ACTN|nr:hypothetical protein [Acrocarpospora corrugata]GES04270.1 hypothetical protein Acor_63380 [Acrocarpospora corrugata]